MAIPILNGESKTITTKAQAKASARIGRRLARAAMASGKCDGLRDLYRSPSGYEAWNDHIAMATIIERGFTELIGPGQVLDDDGRAMAMSSLIAHIAAKADAPPRYLDARLAESFHHTDVPALTGDDAPPMPLPAFRIFFPCGTLRTETDFPINTAIVAEREIARRMFLGYGHKPEDLPKQEPGFLALFIPLTGETYFKDFVWSDPYSSRRRVNTDLHIEAVIAKATAFCAHTILTMVHKPELITTAPQASVSAGRGFGRSNERMPLPPVWIGRGHQPRTNRKTEPSSIHGGSVRPHWRRGHWRHAACGKQRKQRRLVWIKPIYVNP